MTDNPTTCTATMQRTPLDHPEHTCRRFREHSGMHRCPVCSSHWSTDTSKETTR